MVRGAHPDEQPRKRQATQGPRTDAPESVAANELPGVWAAADSAENGGTRAMSRVLA